MLIITYDIANDKLRTAFSKFIKKYGYRLQYSIYEIKNSPRILENIETKIKNDFETKFTQSDSIMIFNLSKQCKITRYGYAEGDEDELIFID